MIIAFDAQYYDDISILAAATFEAWEDPEPTSLKSYQFGPAKAYEPGNFYKRELPLILDALKEVDLQKIDAIVVDGYVTLSAQGKLGLGGHLHQALEHRIPVIGVAKSYFHQSGALEVFRGQSTRPLFVTSLGMSPEEAAKKIRAMEGDYRMPTLLRLVDQATKTRDA